MGSTPIAGWFLWKFHGIPSIFMGFGGTPVLGNLPITMNRWYQPFPNRWCLWYCFTNINSCGVVIWTSQALMMCEMLVLITGCKMLLLWISCCGLKRVIRTSWPIEPHERWCQSLLTKLFLSLVSIAGNYRK
jgi:hypothetical protein